MWFKNLRVYQFTQPFQLPADFESMLNEHLFKPCGRSEPASIGWTSPVRDSDLPLLRQGEQILLCLRKEEKVLPASAVTSELDGRKEAYEQEHARPMPRKEQQALKEDIVHNLLPRALSRFSVTWAILDMAKQRLLVDTSSATRAEEFTAQLRSCLGSLPVRPWGADQPASHILTEWVRQGAAQSPFALGEDAELRSHREEGMVIRLKRHDLGVPEVRQHLEHDKHVTELGLHWDDHLQFLLNDEFAVKRLKFGDRLLEQRDSESAASAAEQLDNDFALMHAEFSALLDALEVAFEFAKTS